jgi:predicted secreted hydrolase
VRGLAWMDHQWGDPWPGRDVRWDWHGLHLEDGTDLMLFDMTRPDGTARAVHGTRTFPDGRVHALVGLRLVPLGVERVPGGGRYALRWQVAAEGLELVLTPTRLDQQVASRAGVTYWEGAVRAEGTLDGRRVVGLGMGEHLPWPRGGTLGACASTTSPAR